MISELPFKHWSPTIHYAQTQKLKKGRLSKRRLYDCELLFVMEGTASSEINNNVYNLQAGELIFFAPGVYHQNEVLSEEASFLGIHFSFLDDSDNINETDMIVNEQEVQLQKFTKELYFPPFHPLSNHVVYKPNAVCIQLLKDLVHEYNHRSPGYELMCKSYMLNILTLLFRMELSKRLDDKSVHSVSIRKILKEIQSSPHMNWTNKILAKKMNVSEDYMSKLFKQVVGLSPTEYIASVRISSARQLLRESQLSIEVIGKHVGYQDAHYFSRIFKKLEGISPREYRKLSHIL